MRSRASSSAAICSLGQAATRVLDLRARDAQGFRRQLDAVEAARIVDQGLIAARDDIRDDVADDRIDVFRRLALHVQKLFEFFAEIGGGGVEPERHRISPENVRTGERFVGGGGFLSSVARTASAALVAVSRRVAGAPARAEIGHAGLKAFDLEANGAAAGKDQKSRCRRARRRR